VRFLIDECMSRTLVRLMRLDGHDVLWPVETGPGVRDDDLLALSVAEDRILTSEDWDFGDLVFRHGRRAIGIVLVTLTDAADAAVVAQRVIRRLTALGEPELRGRFTVLEAGRTRQRDLPSPTEPH
jgi:predicted nuclease of predicted toxin-antitoxin system